MDRQALSDRLMATFLVEIEEQVQTMTRELLALERDPAAAGSALQVVFRAAHSLKGAARAVNIAPIERVCHQLESLLSAARDGRHAVDADLTKRSFAAIRALDDASRRLRANERLVPGPLEDVLPLLTHGHTESAARAAAEPRATRPARQTTAVGDGTPSVEAVPAQERIIKVSTDTLDSLLANSGELLIARRRAAAECDEAATLHEDVRALRVSWLRLLQPLRRQMRRDAGAFWSRASGDVEQTELRLKTLEHRVDQLTTRVRRAVQALDRAAAAVEHDVRRTRLVPFSEACEGLALAARDPSAPSDAPIDLVVEGGDVLLGRTVVDALRAPLLQLVRNAVAHGSQSAQERAALGKPSRARIVVSATLHGDIVHISVSDDGRGLDRRAIADAAARSGLPEPRSMEDALSLIFHPGFSTSSRPSALSGRGVGLDIVRHQTEALQGHAEAALLPEGGLRISMRVPVTLTTLRALFVKEAGQTFAIPLSGIRHLARARAADFVAASGRDMLVTNDGPVPAASLAQLLKLDAPARPANDRIPMVLLRSGRAQAAVAVQELLAEEEILVKPVGPRLQGAPHLSGATILPTGHVAFLLNPARIVQAALASEGAPMKVRPTPDATIVARPLRHRILLADDSVTTRTLERSILEAAGYDVVVAVDGAQAWNLLVADGADLVVADVEMPRMDGLMLCEAIRQSRRFHDVPVVLVTGVESDAARRRGLDAGANAYLPKSSFDQQTLVETIGRLLQ